MRSVDNVFLEMNHYIDSKLVECKRAVPKEPTPSTLKAPTNSVLAKPAVTIQNKILKPADKAQTLQKVERRPVEFPKTYDLEFLSKTSSPTRKVVEVYEKKETDVEKRPSFDT